jgi:H+/Cl- antiporter ClcA
VTDARAGYALGVPTRRERQATRRQFAEACILAGIAALIGTPLVYRFRTANAHARVTHNWLWPTWWMLVPLLVAIVGVVITLLPASFDLRRSLLARRHSRRHGS